MVKLLKLALKRAPWYILGFTALIITDLAQIAIPKFLMPAAFDIAVGEREGNLLIYTLITILTAIVIAAGRFVWRTAILGSSRHIETGLRERLFGSLLKLSSTFFKEYKTGDLMARATNDLKMIRTATGMAFVAFVDSFIMLLITMVTALSSYGLLALVIMSGLALIPVTLLVMGAVAMKRFREVQEAYSAITGYVQEQLNGIRVIKTLAKEEFSLQRFSRLNEAYKEKYKSVIRTFGMIFPVINFFWGISTILMLRLGGMQVLRGELSPGNFAALFYFIGLMVWPMIGIGYSLNMLMRGMVSMKRVNEVLDRQPDIPYEEDPGNREGESTQPAAKECTIEFRDLHYSYPDQPETEVLKGINLKIEPGEMIGILGRTGSGKSTLINLIPRLLNPPRGSLFIDGEDAVDRPLSSLRSLVTLVPQETLLFSETIRNNIAFGAPDPKKADEQELQAAAQASTISRDFSIFPAGWETTIGEKGTTISGGQKQRLAISRALMKDAPLMIFDDALASVDTSTEEKILNSIENYRGAKSLILISHRVSTLRNCDRIVVLNRGRIVEEGTHDMLMEQSGIYREIAVIQQATTPPTDNEADKGNLNHE